MLLRRRRIIAAFAAAHALALATPGASSAAIGEPSGTPWTPFGAGELFHVASTSFAPKIEPVAGDSAAQIKRSLFWTQPTLEETWLASDGHGTELTVYGGGGDPAKYPRLFIHNGRIQGHSGTYTPETDPSLYAASLKYPDATNVTSWRTQGGISNTQWYRVPNGFRRGGHFTGRQMGGVARRQREVWGATLEQLEAVNTKAGAELDLAVEELINAPVGERSFYYTPVGRYGVTKATVIAERRVRRAVRLLANAPLSASARAAIVRWLSAQSDATVRTGVTDERGRAGTRIMIETVRSIPIPAKVITLAQLKRRAGIRADAVVRNGHTIYRIPAHHEFRRWQVSVVVDASNNELLQRSLYSRWENDAMLPRIQSAGRGGGLRVSLAVERQGEFDAAVYDARERVSIIEPRAEVCVDHPGVCH